MNIREFNSITKNKYVNEHMEFLKCLECSLILVGIPDCHIAFYDSNNLKKTIGYNLPRHVRCPKCKSTWYKLGMDHWELKSATAEEAKNSDWNWSE